VNARDAVSRDSTRDTGKEGNLFCLPHRRRQNETKGLMGWERKREAAS
jgi:hypothetical protein